MSQASTMPSSAQTSADNQRRKRKARMTAVWLGLMSLAFYFGFIAIGALRS